VIRHRYLIAAVALLGLTTPSLANITVNYTADAGGSNPDPLNGLAASAEFSIAGTQPIVSGDSAVIGAGSVGLGTWAGEGPGYNVGDEWLWTNDGAGDLLETFTQVISTSQGADGGTNVSFNGVPDPMVGGPFGGIAAAPPFLAVPGAQPAVSDSIEFTLTLSGTLTKSQLVAIAEDSIVEFGSDYQYLAVPAPGTLCLLALALAGRRRRSRSG
jgi:hypothetical protein